MDFIRYIIDNIFVSSRTQDSVKFQLDTKFALVARGDCTVDVILELTSLPNRARSVQDSAIFFPP